MPRKTIVQRTRFFIAVEGDGEQSFVKWLQELSEQLGLHIHLDCQPLGGGGYKTMLAEVVRQRQRKERYSAKSTILIVDLDRAIREDDGWAIQKLQEEAKKAKVDICLQSPNQEGLFLRMFKGNEQVQPNASNTLAQLQRVWPDYRKPVDSRTLSSKFSLDDLLRVAKHDQSLKGLLITLGFEL